MTAQDRISITGFVTVGALVVALGGLTFVQIDWLRGDVNSRIGELNSRIDGVEERLNSRIDGVEERLNSRIDGVEERLNSRIDGVEEGLNSRIDGVETRMSDLEEAMLVLGERMARFEGTLSAVVALVGLNEAPGDPDGEARR